MITQTERKTGSTYCSVSLGLLENDAIEKRRKMYTPTKSGILASFICVDGKAVDTDELTML